MIHDSWVMVLASSIMEVKTNPLYWDCECSEKYIHKKIEATECLICGYCAEDMPDSRQSEIDSGKYFVDRSSQGKEKLETFMEKELENIWEALFTLEQFVISLYDGEHNIPSDMQEKIDDWKTSMALIREGLGLPSEVERENNK